MNLKRLFKPKTMAVIGVSLSNETHPANVIYNKNRSRYPVEVFPVNPKGGTYQGSRLYRNIGQIPEPVDLAVIAVRSEYTADIMADCIENDVGGAVIISGGFAEVGNVDLQDHLVNIAQKANFPFVGPNCLGLYSSLAVDTFFLPSERNIRPSYGNVAFVSQSGGVLVDQLVKFAKQGVGVSLAASIGNKALLREIDLIRYLDGDPDTRVIAFYIEGFNRNEGREFVHVARQCEKPIIVYKSGKSPGGMQAISSHTASMAGDYLVFSEVLKQYGIPEAKSGQELTSFCQSLSYYYYQKSVGKNIGIISVTGGHGVLAMDICSQHGLSTPRLPKETVDKLKAVVAPKVRDIASFRNPLDMTGSAVDDDYVAVARGLSESPDVDCILIMIVPYSAGISVDLGAKLSHACRPSGKPVFAYVPNDEKYRMLIEGFEYNHIPVSPSIEGAVLMIEALRRHRHDNG